jgi:branched-chain amino acid transport system permease protein
VIAVAALVGVFLWIVNERTLIGARVRATVDDPEIAAAIGINVTRLSGGVFAAGAALAALDPFSVAMREWISSCCRWRSWS